MNAEYGLTFDLIIERGGFYNRDRVERVNARETRCFYFVRTGFVDLKFRKLENPGSDGRVSQSSNGEGCLYNLNSPKAQTIRNNEQVRAMGLQVKQAISNLIKADMNDPRIAEIAKILGIKADLQTEK